MVHPELVDYIRRELAAGISKDVLIDVLKKATWRDADISNAFAEIEKPAVKPVPPMPTAPVPITPPTLKPTPPATLAPVTLPPIIKPVSPVVPVATPVAIKLTVPTVERIAELTEHQMYVELPKTNISSTPSLVKPVEKIPPTEPKASDMEKFIPRLNPNPNQTAPVPLKTPETPVPLIKTSGTTFTPRINPSPISTMPRASDFETPRKKKSGHLFSIIFVLLLLGALGTGSVFGYPYYQSYLPESIKQLPPFSLFEKSPAVILGLAYQKTALEMAKGGNTEISFSFDTTFPAVLHLKPGIASTSTQPEKLSLNAEIHVLTDLEDKTNPKIQSNFNANGTLAEEGAPQTPFKVSLEHISLDKNIYLKLDELSLPFIPVDLSAATGKWIKIPVASTTATSTISATVSSKLSPEENLAKLEKVRDIVLKHAMALLGQIQKLSDEEIDGVQTMHFDVPLNKLELPSLIHEIGDATGATSTEAMKKQEDLILSSIDFKTMQVWIGKDDSLIHRTFVAWSATIPKPSLLQNPKDSQPIPANIDVEIPMNFSITTNLSPLSGSPLITAPEPTVDVETFVQTLFKQIFQPQIPPPPKK